VRDLLEQGVIDIAAVTDPVALGYRHAAMVGLRVAGAARFEVAERAGLLDAADFVAVTTGRFGVLIEVYAASLSELGRLLDTLGAMDGVADVESLLYLAPASWDAAFRRSGHLGRRDERRSPGAGFEELDLRILACLNRDGRMPYLHVATELGVSERVVRRRVVLMREHGTARVVALVNPMTIGYETAALVGVRVAAGASSAAVATALRSTDPVVFVAQCAGRFDILIEVLCTSPLELLEVLDERVRPVGGVQAAEAFVYLDLRHRALTRPAAIG
jgi:Lrp/AsnC family transcriptional regulator for asnA, asnC and gidA